MACNAVRLNDIYPCDRSERPHKTHAHAMSEPMRRSLFKYTTAWIAWQDGDSEPRFTWTAEAPKRDLVFGRF